ncbi:MAG TPA: glycerophosphodiester phosphodiesterase family protein [Thermomicrobiales bacterium]|nr:glycerophosphodiester phosphodiesterase family protein [Thermomicrobiales bacterium]
MPFQLIAHRGARGEAPENTIAGFRYARELGLEAVELDVRLSRDNQLVVIHDDTVDRTTDGTGPVSSFTAAELAALDARGSCPDWPENVGIPTFQDALDAILAFPLVQIEIKTDTSERMEAIILSLLQTIRQHDIAERVILSSFSETAIELIATHAPDQARAYIGAYDSDDDLTTALRHGCTQADISLATGSREMVARAHDHGLRVVGYQCNDADALARCLDWEMDGATSDVPSSILPLMNKETH